MSTDVSRRPLDLAVELVRAGADVVVVGSAARALRGAAPAPRDLDVAVAPAALAGLVGALSRLGTATSAARLLRCGCSRLTTTYGPLDVFVGPRPGSEVVAVDGVLLAVVA